MAKKSFYSLIAALVMICGISSAAEKTRILFLHKSAGFQHSCIAYHDGKETNHVTEVLNGLGDKLNAEITSTKDASLINAENLKNYDVVMFYTTGDLTKTTGDKAPAMGENGVAELQDWVKAGGGFIGYHCATDTFHRTKDKDSPFLDMLGGEFAGHGPQFYGKLKIVDPDHPTIARVANDFRIKDEWYFFSSLMEEDMHVIALLDAGKMKEKDERYDMPNYPVIWCSKFGDGRVFYNAMGHREDVWDHEVFQNHFIDAVNWAKGEGEADYEPNYKDVVPTE